MEGRRAATDQGAQSGPERTEVIAQGDTAMSGLDRATARRLQPYADALGVDLEVGLDGMDGALARIEALEQRCNELESVLSKFGGEHVAVISAVFGALGAMPGLTDLHKAIRRSLKETRSGIFTPETNPFFREAFSYASEMIDAGIDRGIEMAISDHTN
jgi:hypothetical protein